MIYNLIMAAVIGYVFGSIPFGLIFTRLAGLGDVREIGSGNIGATNVLRTGSKGLAALTLLADMAKGFVPVFIVSSYFVTFSDSMPVIEPLLTGLMALLGHMFPIWLKFKGGKGVATYIGVAFGLYWPLGLCFIVTWLLVAFTLKYSSASALIACLVTPVFAYFFVNEWLAFPLFFMSMLVIIRHRENIERLIAGEEDKIGQKQSS